MPYAILFDTRVFNFVSVYTTELLARMDCVANPYALLSIVCVVDFKLPVKMGEVFSSFSNVTTLTGKNSSTISNVRLVLSVGILSDVALAG